MATKYEPDDWERLGSQIGQSRRIAGYSDTAKWAAAIGRSTRVALGLERGEHAGRKTLEAVENALGWDPGTCYEILGSGGEIPKHVALLNEIDQEWNPLVVTGLVVEADRDERGDWLVRAVSTSPTSRLEIRYWPGEGRAARSMTEMSDLAYETHVSAERATIPDEGGDGHADDTGRSSSMTKDDVDLVADVDENMDAEAEADPHA